MASGAVTVRCPGCSRPRQVHPRPDGTLPATVRCAASLGGCGKKSMRVPRPAGTTREAGAVAAAAAGAWEPPSEPRGVRRCGGPCPHCGQGEVYAEPRGTLRLCLACKQRVTPPGVLAPYERGTGGARTAKSQRERDLEAIAVASRKGVMLAELAQLATDERLHPQSRPVVEWLAEQVKAAGADGRLDELAALLPEAGIKYRRFWHRRPALPAGYAEADEDGYLGEDDGQDDEAAALSAVPAAAVAEQPRRMTWAMALAALGWRLYPVNDGGGCQVMGPRGRCGDPETPHHIGGHTGPGWVCSPHHAALCAAISNYNQRSA